MSKIIIQKVSNEELKDVFKIRRKVFVIEQKVDPALEVDGLDKECDQFLAYDENRPVGTTRVRYLAGNEAKIERMAVLKDFRGKNIGSELIKFILDYLEQKGIETVVMNAQLYAKNFYGKFGFEAQGDIFKEAGIKHIKMKKNL